MMRTATFSSGPLKRASFASARMIGEGSGGKSRPHRGYNSSVQARISCSFDIMAACGATRGALRLPHSGAASIGPGEARRASAPPSLPSRRGWLCEARRRTPHPRKGLRGLRRTDGSARHRSPAAKAKSASTAWAISATPLWPCSSIELSQRGLVSRPRTTRAISCWKERATGASGLLVSR